MNPFCALLKIRSVVVSSLLLIALDSTLYRFDKREIGRQFFMLVFSPFFGINLIVADLKVLVRVPFLKQQVAYLKSGTRKYFQNLEIKRVLNPSIPAAEFMFAFLIASSSSLIAKLDSSLVLSAAVSMLFLTREELRISGPKNFSMQPVKFSGSVAGFV